MPPDVAWHSDGMTSVPEDDDWVDEQLASRLDRMVYTKRRSESRLGRWTAKNALARVLGIGPDELHRVAVRNAVDGAPEAYLDGRPAGVTVAMTDRADWAVCTVLGGAARVGCDLELVEPRSDAFVRDYFTAAEQALVFEGNDRDAVANLVWSAKESALKVLRTGLRRDTRSVVVTLGDEHLDGWQALEVRPVEGGVLPGWWRRYGDFVLTCATAEPTAPPRSLDEPPALATATPQHRWMTTPLRPGAGG